MTERHRVKVQVAQSYLDGAGITRARWVDHGTDELAASEAEAFVKALRQRFGAARVECAAFEAVALRNSFGLKLIEGG